MDIEIYCPDCKRKGMDNLFSLEYSHTIGMVASPISRDFYGLVCNIHGYKGKIERIIRSHETSE